MSLYCPSCGRSLLQDARFCTLCGNAVPPEAFNPIHPPGVAAPVTLEEVHPPIETTFPPPLQPAYSQETTDAPYAADLVYPLPRPTNTGKSHMRVWLWGGIALAIALLVVILLFLLLPSTQSTVFNGKWTRITSLATTVPAMTSIANSTGIVTSLFGRAYANYCSSSSDMMEFFDDGTIEMRTDQEYPGSSALFRSVFLGEYRVLDGAHIQFKSFGTNTMLDFDLSGEVLTIHHQKPCGDVQWKRIVIDEVERAMDSPMNVVELYYRASLDEHSADYGNYDLAFSLLAPESHISNAADLRQRSEEWKKEHETLIGLQISATVGREEWKEPDATAHLIVQSTYSDGLVSSAFVQLHRQGDRFLITDVGP
jgi:hypothetical protein